ncbi:MAG: carboxypeptidase-like regulatory domain-containing protein [Actinomycetota bacterium]|nr:carboxypeptidase-like regulatory domain-containing protein [Actinomycetota bacterium]
MSNDDGKASWISKIVLPVIVAVIGAIAVAALTPAGEWISEQLFPTFAVVRGVVQLGGVPVAGAEVRIDDRRHQPTDPSGTFLIADVESGSHSLQVDVIGGRPYRSSFVIKKRTEEIDLGVIDVEEALRLVGDGSIRARPPRLGRAESFTIIFDYDLMVWIEGDRDVVSNIEKVTYLFPTRIRATPVAGSTASEEFCHRAIGSIEVGMGENVQGRIVAEVNLGGQTIRLSTDASSPQENLPSGQRPNCNAVSRRSG